MTDEEIRRIIIANRRRKMAKRRRNAACVVLFIAIMAGLIIGGIVGASKAGKDMPEEAIKVAEDTPFINTAMAEIGNKGGEKFWSWYGFDSRVAWCACYISWVEDKVGYLSEGIAPKFSLVSDGADWFKSNDKWIEAGETPAAGDLIFFDWEQDGVLDHVGIVTRAVDGKVFSVEGNSSDRCRLKRYYTGDKVIAGYGHIEAPEAAAETTETTES